MVLGDLLTENEDPDCLLRYVHGCGRLDRELLHFLLETEERLSVEELATSMDRDRSTVYRSIRRLEEYSYVTKARHTYENGGYCYRYAAAEPDAIAAHLEHRVEACQDRLGELMTEFRSTYCEESS